MPDASVNRATKIGVRQPPGRPKKQLAGAMGHAATSRQQKGGLFPMCEYKGILPTHDLPTDEIREKKGIVSPAYFGSIWFLANGVKMQRGVPVDLTASGVSCRFLSPNKE